MSVATTLKFDSKRTFSPPSFGRGLAEAQPRDPSEGYALAFALGYLYGKQDRAFAEPPESYSDDERQAYSDGLYEGLLESDADKRDTWLAELERIELESAWADQSGYGYVADR